jgi:hypothetical protein
VSGADEEVLREIFDRMNASGKALTSAQVFNALHGGGGEEPTSLTALAEKLVDLRFGRLDEDLLLTVLFAIRGLDITKGARDLARDPRLEGALSVGEDALRRAIIFLKTHARVPHVRVLPYRLALQVLARFFALHKEPRSRSLDLLSRWLWRGAISGAHGTSSRAFEREQLGAVGSDEEASVQKLLASLPKEKEPSRTKALDEFRLSQKAQSRIQALALIALVPRHLKTGAPVPPESLLETLGDDSLPEILPRRAAAAEPERERARSVANRLFHGPEGKPQLQAWIRAQGDPEILASHGISALARDAMVAGEFGDFLATREIALVVHLERFVKARAAWNLPDRPSLQYVLRLDELAGQP